MHKRTSNLLFWASLGGGALVVTTQSVLLYGWIGAPLGIGTGGSLGAVVYYLGAMLFSASRWIRQQLKRP
ncbi:MAG: hypothetical protein KY445_03290 [Armatimonadetes bacterium]|nr:hypothetical protein [Armatimonadota bacterium]